MKEHNSFRFLPDVDIYFYSLDVSSSERERLFQFLSEKEKQRAAHYHFDLHRFRYISGQGKLREILAETVDCKPEEVIFGRGEFGKPFIKQPYTSSNIQFNVSKSSATGCVAISQDSQIGIDIEQIKYDGNSDFDQIVKNEFTNDEMIWYQNVDIRNRHIAFYTLWTCKEAYLKALGSGLSDALDKFTVTIGGTQPVIRYTELEPDTNSVFTLYQEKLSDDYIFCLASATKGYRIRSIGSC